MRHFKWILECIFLRGKSFFFKKIGFFFTEKNFCVSANILLLKNQIDDGKVGRWFRGKNFVLSPLLIGGARALKKRVIGWKSEKKVPPAAFQLVALHSFVCRKLLEAEAEIRGKLLFKEGFNTSPCHLQCRARVLGW